MDYLHELYYFLGRLEGLATKDNIESKELGFIRNIISKNKFFIENEGFMDNEASNYINSIYYDDDEPISMGNPKFDRNENPWIDVFGEGEEADAAYWNTD